MYRFNGGSRNIFPNVVQVVGGINELTNSLWLHKCSNFECLIDTAQHVEFFSLKLIKLRLSSIDNVKGVCHGQPLFCIFKILEELHIMWCSRLGSIFLGQMTLGNLKIVKIKDCARLRSLFPMSVARIMLLLQELTIKSYSKLKSIIGEDGSSTGLEIIPVSDNSCFVFPKLKFLSISFCNE